MSFFGFDPTKPTTQTHNSKAPGFGATPDPFAGLSNRTLDDEAGEALNFDDEDDELGNRLEESGDTFNDATFGTKDIGTDFDFSQGTLSQAPMAARAPDQHALSGLGQRYAQPKPAQTGYEKYKRPNQMRDLQPDASIWGLGPQRPDPKPKQQPQTYVEVPSIEKVTRSMMTLEEVEAMMRPQTKQPTPDPIGSIQGQPGGMIRDQRIGSAASGPLQEQQMPSFRRHREAQQTPAMPLYNQGSSQRRPETPQSQALSQQHPDRQIQPQVTQYHSRETACSHRRDKSGVSLAQLHHRGPSLNGQPVTRADQITQLSEEERAAFLRDEANRAKRNHKIHLLSRDNGLMTPQDKNFITRIQLSQLVQATGVDEDEPEAAQTEDFYYQVYSRIYTAALENGISPSTFTQTYLNQLSWKGGSRRYPRGGESHMRRMEQQVQRAVEAARSRPKNKQLVMEGSLGKISFSNAKTPKPLLNIKRNDNQDSSHTQNKPRPQDAVGGRKAILQDIETVYTSLMRIEDCERNQPPQPREESSGDEIQAFMDWRHRLSELNQNLWNDWKVHAPIDTDSSTPHPFMAMLSHPKGKKLIPRVFRQIDDQQRLTVLTIIVVQLDQLDVIRDVQPIANRTTLPPNVRLEVDLFAQAVEPSLFAYIADAALAVVTGLVGLVCQRVDMQMVIRSSAGVNLLTRLLSRAMQIVQGNANTQDSEQWSTIFNSFFDQVEPHLPSIFQSTLAPGEDFFIWQFLAACGIPASADQQQRLVIAVKDRVMETVDHAKSLPEPQGQPDLDKVNLFMHAIGLDVDLLG